MVTKERDLESIEEMAQEIVESLNTKAKKAKVAKEHSAREIEGMYNMIVKVHSKVWDI